MSLLALQTIYIISFATEYTEYSVIHTKEMHAAEQ